MNTTTEQITKSQLGRLHSSMDIAKQIYVSAFDQAYACAKAAGYAYPSSLASKVSVVGYFDFGVQFVACGLLGCAGEINQSRRCIARQQNLEAQSENLGGKRQAGRQASHAGPEHLRV